MREDNLLCLRRRKFVVTTDSNHSRPVYPNLARGMVLTDVNQLWVADITYIRLETEFVYLAVVLDAFSRRVIGWALDRTLEDELTITALRMALERRIPAPALIHHSDRGVQYASKDYTDLLKDRGINISMSRKGNPYDNAALRILHEDAQIRRSASAGVSRSGRRSNFDRALPGAGLQPKTTPLGARLPATRGVRTEPAHARSRGPGMKAALRFLRHGGIYRSDVVHNQFEPGLARRLPLVGARHPVKIATEGTRPTHPHRPR